MSQAFGHRLWTIGGFLLATTTSMPVAAQWKIETRSVFVASADSDIALEVDLPVLVSGGSVSVRKRINKALGKVCDVDSLARSAEELSRIRNSYLKEAARAKKHDHSDEDDFGRDDSFDQRTIQYKVGLNDGKLLSIYFDGYWRGSKGLGGTGYGMGCTFDARTGQQFQLRDLIAAGSENALRALVLDQIDPEMIDARFDVKEIVGKGAIEFYLAPASMVVFFQSGVIAVNHEGVHFIDIPYAALKSLIPAQSPLAHLVAKK